MVYFELVVFELLIDYRTESENKKDFNVYFGRNVRKYSTLITDK